MTVRCWPMLRGILIHEPDTVPLGNGDAFRGESVRGNIHDVHRAISHADKTVFADKFLIVFAPGGSWRVSEAASGQYKHGSDKRGNSSFHIGTVVLPPEFLKAFPCWAWQRFLLELVVALCLNLLCQGVIPGFNNLAVNHDMNGIRFHVVKDAFVVRDQ